MPILQYTVTVKKDTESRIALEKQKQVEESLLTASVKRIEEGIEEIKTKQTNQDKKSEDLLVVVTKHEVVLGDLSRRMDEVEGCVYKK